MGLQLRYALLFLLYLLPTIPLVAGDKSELTQGDTIFYTGFENGIPAGWVQQVVYMPPDNPYPAYWDTRTGAGLISPPPNSIPGYPYTAAAGTKNLVFQFQGMGHVTRLITRPINLEFAIFPELSFYHAQNKWGDDGPDHLKIFYRQGETGPWVLHRSYPSEVPEWIHRTIPLPSGSSDLYLAFEGLNMYGMGICIDEVLILETGVVPRELSHFKTEQASTSFLASGTKNNPILKSQIRVTGNTGNLILDKYTAHSLNTNDGDIAPSGVKLYFTEDENFNTSNLLGNASDFAGGIATFNNLNIDLPTGYSYLWLTYDLSSDAVQGHFADAYIPVNGITIDGVNLPGEVQDPPGNRVIYPTIFHDDFDTNKGWILTGEWERDVPQGLGGSFGFPGADHAYIGSKVLGTDLTGLGAFPGDYEPNLDFLEYQAISPEFNCFYYNNITLSFKEWLNIEPSDKAFLHISGDGGITWTKVWENVYLNNANKWDSRLIPLPAANRKERVRLRFSIGTTDDSYNASGWNIDNLVVTGTFVTRDVGVTEWLSVNKACEMTENEEVVVRIKNFGAGPINNPIPVGFSLDKGKTWHMDVANQSIPVGGTIVHNFTPKADFSVPGRYNEIIVKTFLNADEDNTNDALNYSVFSVPTYTPPYSEIFFSGDGNWSGYGTESSWRWGVPQGTEIKNAQLGLRSWVTNISGAYNSNEASWLESPCFDFSAMENPVMEFYLNTHTPEGIDGASLQYSIDQGATWHSVGLLNEAFAWNWFDDDPILKLSEKFNQDFGWHGTTNGWKKVRAVLDTQTTFQELVKFRIIFAADTYAPDSNPWEGIGFDNVSIYQAPHDVGVTALIDPVNACELSENEQVTIRIHNLGFRTIESGTDIPLGIDIATHPTVYEIKTLDANLAPGQFTEYTFTTLFDLREEGTHIVKAYTMLPGDSDFYIPGVFNDTLATTYTVFGYPDFTLGEDIYTIDPMSVVLDAGAEYIAFLWHDNSTNQTFNVNSIYTETYSVTVTDVHNCQVFDSLRVITYDLQIADLEQPADACELTTEEYITIRIRNAGYDEFPAGTEIPVAVYYEGILHDSYNLILGSALLPTDAVTYTFSKPADLTEVGEHNFKITHDFKDGNPLNNELITSVIVHGYPEVFIPPFVVSDFPETVVLDPGSGFATYEWQDGSTDQQFNVDTWGDFWVDVTNDFGCASRANSSVVPELFDVMVSEVVSPQNLCIDSEDQPISLMVMNAGNSTIPAGTGMTIRFYVESDLMAEKDITIETSLPKGSTQLCTFTEKWSADIAGDYNISATVEFALDEIPENDTFTGIAKIHNLPQPGLGGFIYTSKADTLVLRTSQPFESYLWDNGSTSSEFPVLSLQTNTYGVTVTDQYGCVNHESVTVVTYDLQLAEIISPVSNCMLTNQESIVVRVNNMGYDDFEAGDKIEIAYQHRTYPSVLQEFTLNEGWLKNTTKEFIFTNTVNLTSQGAHNLKVYVATPNANEGNDTINTVVEIKGLPQISLGSHVYTTRPDTVVLDPGAGFAAYLWHDGQTTQQYHVNSFGWKWVKVYDEYGCMTADTTFVGQFVNVEEISGNSLITQVYPNPARDILNLEIEGLFDEKILIEIFDAKGILVYKDVISNVAALHTKIDVSALRSGTYLLNIQTNTIRKTHLISIIKT